MKKIMFSIGIACIVFISCSKDDSLPNPDGEISIKSFSENSGYSGDTIKIIGENFPTDTNKISIKFDTTPAQILKATITEIEIILPETEAEIPTLSITVNNKAISNNIKTPYDGNIKISPLHVYNTWLITEGDTPLEESINHAQMIDDKTFYYSVQTSFNIFEGIVMRTVDGGQTWQKRSDTDQLRIFYATKNGGLWSEWRFGLNITLKDKTSSLLKHLFNTCTAAFHVEENLLEGTAVDMNGTVHTTTNGGQSFSPIHTSNLSSKDDSLYQSYTLDKNNIWVIGYKYIGSTQTPYLLYKHNGNAWMEKAFTDLPNQRAENITFSNQNIGTLTTSQAILLTTDGGDTWKQLKTGRSKCIFVSDKVGYYISDYSIRKTTDGGTTWNDEIKDKNKYFKTIECKNNVIWAIAGNKSYKLYYKEYK